MVHMDPYFRANPFAHLLCVLSLRLRSTWTVWTGQNLRIGCTSRCQAPAPLSAPLRVALGHQRRPATIKDPLVEVWVRVIAVIAVILLPPSCMRRRNARPYSAVTRTTSQGLGVL